MSSCCLKSACRGQTAKLSEKLEKSGSQSESGSNPQRGLFPSLWDLAKLDKVSHSHKLLCQSPQELLPVRGIISAYRQNCSRIGQKSDISRVFQPAVFSPETQQQLKTYIKSEQTKPILKVEKFKVETLETIRTSL